LLWGRNVLISCVCCVNPLAFQIPIFNICAIAMFCCQWLVYELDNNFERSSTANAVPAKYGLYPIPTTDVNAPSPNCSDGNNLIPRTLIKFIQLAITRLRMRRHLLCWVP
jgi:hypothetical protein